MNNDKNKDIDLKLHDKTGALLILNKDERRLVRELLSIALRSENAREYITNKLGSQYIEVGQKLLKTMGE